jgi:hypothetical protein
MQREGKKADLSTRSKPVDSMADTLAEENNIPYLQMFHFRREFVNGWRLLGHPFLKASAGILLRVVLLT